MTKRGKKSRVIIAGHTLTFAELTVLRQLQDYARRVSGDGRTVALSEFSGDNAKRYCARHLGEVGVLKACGIELLDERNTNR
jgi:hypothetical protein